jgi:hypothetical protein
MSWPHVIYLTVATGFWLFAVATAWKSADRVIPTNRGWTRAWRILVTVLAFGPAGWLVPVGALYIVARHGSVWRTAPRTVAH